MVYLGDAIPGDFQVPGFLFGATSCGIKGPGQPDLALIFSQCRCQTVGFFTTNKVKAAPVLVSKARVARGQAQAVIVNSGNANAATGKRGQRHSLEMAALAATKLGIEPGLVLVCSTGRIGLPLPLERIRQGMDQLTFSLSPTGYRAFAQAIMTTDRHPKLAAARVLLGGRTVNFLAITKGAGMIQPELATMLSFTLTDLGLQRPSLWKVFKQAVNASYNCVSVDGQRSTNDTALIMANSMAGNGALIPKELDRLAALLANLHLSLARQIVKDGEGASKLLEIFVRGAKTTGQARKAAYAVGNSSLVKTAFFGQQLNWGRIISALGASEVDMTLEKTDIWIQGVPVVRRGEGTAESWQRQASRALKEEEVSITIDLHKGEGQARICASDLTYDYVRLNAGHEGPS